MAPCPSTPPGARAPRKTCPCPKKPCPPAQSLNAGLQPWQTAAAAVCISPAQPQQLPYEAAAVAPCSPFAQLHLAAGAAADPVQMSMEALACCSGSKITPVTGSAGVDGATRYTRHQLAEQISVAQDNVGC